MRVLSVVQRASGTPLLEEELVAHDAALRSRDLARQNVDAEQQKYSLGLTTAFEFLDSQTTLATTENALLGAYVTYQQAYVSYQQATWTLLDGLGVVVEKPQVH